MSLKDVKAFYETLAADEVFRAQIQEVKSKDECSQIVKTAGYDFTQEEFEEYTAQLLESTDAESELKDLNGKELQAIFGGGGPDPNQMAYGNVQPIEPPYPGAGNSGPTNA